MLVKSYIFRLLVISTVGMLPLLGYSGSAAAANVGIIKGKVIGQRSKALKSGVNIQITDSNGKVVKSAVSQKDGTYTVLQIPVGQYKVKAGKATAKSIQVAMSPPVTQVDFQVPEKGFLAFTGLGGGALTALVVGGTATTMAIAGAAAHDSGSSRSAPPASP